VDTVVLVGPPATPEQALACDPPAIARLGLTQALRAGGGLEEILRQSRIAHTVTE